MAKWLSVVIVSLRPPIQTTPEAFEFLRACELFLFAITIFSPQRQINPSPHNPDFKHPWDKTLWGKEKTVTIIFSFSHNVFYSTKAHLAIFVLFLLSSLYVLSSDKPKILLCGIESSCILMIVFISKFSIKNSEKLDGNAFKLSP